MSLLRSSYASFTRSFGAAALVLGAVSAQTQVPNRPPAQPVPAVQGDWSCGNVFYVATTGNNGNAGSFASPWRTITFAVAQAQNLTPAGTPITINVRTGTYNALNGETFPITLPARGIKLQAFEPSVTISGQPNDSVLLVNQNGTLSGACGFTPDTVIRGLRLSDGLNGVEISIGGTPVSTPDRVCIQRCRIAYNKFRGILLNTASVRRSQHVIEENEIDHNANFEGFGSGIRAFESGDSSYLIRANNIHDNEVGIEITGTSGQADDIRPRIVSNVVRDSEWGISLAHCSSYLVNNTQAFGRPFSPGQTVYGVLLGGTGDHVVVNNIMWNPTGYGGTLFAIDYEVGPSVTTTEATNWILQVVGLANNPQFVAPPTDLHLASNSPLLEAGTNSFVLPVINITAGTITARADVGMDFDGDSRVLDFDRDASATVEIGADEKTGGATVRLSSSSVDASGNLHTGGVPTTIQLVLNTVPNDLCLVYFWDPAGADQIAPNTFVSPFGNWRITPGVQVGSGAANGAGIFTTNLTLDPAVLGLERQIYVQAITTDAGHSLGTISNRLMIELNQ